MKSVTCSVQGAPQALELCDFDGKHFRLVSASAFAPGQPLMVTVGFAAPITLELKSLGSKRCADGRFEVRARAAILPRDAREALARFFELG